MRGRSFLAALVLCWSIFAATAAEFTSPTLGTSLNEPSDLEIQNIQVLNQLPLPDGRVLLEASAAISNRADGLWSGVTVGYRISIDLGPYQVLASTIDFPGTLAPNSTLVATGGMHLLVSTASLSAARDELLSGAPLVLYATDHNGQRVANPTNDLALINLRILGELAVSAGKTLLIFAADVQNLGSNRWTQLSIALDAALATNEFSAAAAAAAFPTTLPPMGSLSNSPPFYAAVATNDVATAVSNILSGAALTHSGFELFVFNAPPRGIDAETEDAWLPPASTLLGVTTLKFSTHTPYLQSLQPGDLLVEDPGINRLAKSRSNPADPFQQTQPVLADYLPFEVSGITLVDGQVHVIGRVRSLLEVLKSATFFQDARFDAYDGAVRDPYNPTLENTYTAAEKAARALLAEAIEQLDPRDGRLADLRGLNAIHWHFNDLQITDKIRLSGQLLLRSSGLQINARIRNFALQHAYVRLDAGVVMNVVLECGGGENTTNKPAADKMREIFDLNLPVVSLNIAGVPVTVGLVARLTAGVEANIPRRLTLPLQSAFTVGMEMGYDPARPSANARGYFYEPIKEFIPLRVSDPTVFDDLAAEVGAWLELEMGIEGSISEVLNGGPTLAIRLGSDFRLAPLKNPWWAFDVNLDLVSRFSLDLLGVKLVDASANLDHNNLFHRDAGAGLGGIQLAGLTTDFQPVIGQTVRWGRILAPDVNSYAFGASGTRQPGPGAVVLKDGRPGANDLIVAGSPGSLAKFNALGDLLWARDLGANRGMSPQRGVALPDGTFTLLGRRGFDLWLARFDANGNRLWIVSYRSPQPLEGWIVQDFVSGTNGAGQTEYYVVGYVTHGIVTQTDPLVMKFDANGAVLWAKYYAFPGQDEAMGAVLTRDGNLALCGITEADVTAPEYGTPDPGNFGKNIGPEGLLMKVSAADGSLLWATAFASGRGLTLDALAEGPDGTLFVMGGVHLIVPDGFPAVFLGKFTADGTLLDHVTIGEDPDWTDELPTGGTSPYDLGTRLRWTPEGLVACGSTGLGDGRSGWVMALTDELGVKFYTVFDGPKGDWFYDIADAGDGLAVLGNTTVAQRWANFPWTPQVWTAPLLLKLPWEGILRCHENTGIRSLFLQPRVYHSSASTLFQVHSSHGQSTFSNAQSPAPLVPTDLPWTAGGSLPAPVTNNSYTTFRVEALDPGLIQTYDDWAFYHGLSGSNAHGAADIDGDGLANIFESYFGRNPRVRETSDPVTITLTPNFPPMVTLEFLRSAHAGNLGVRAQSSINLVDWLDFTGFTEEVTPLSDSLVRVRLSTPANEPLRFWRWRADGSASP